VKELLIIGEREEDTKTLYTFLMRRLKGWRTASLVHHRLRYRRSLPDLTVVDLSSRLSTQDLDAFGSILGKRQDKSDTYAFVIVNFGWKEGLDKPEMMKFLSHFSRPDHVRVFRSADREMLEAAVDSVEPTIELLRSNYRLADTAQLSSEASERYSRADPGNDDAPKASMLDTMKKVLDSTKDLRAENGKLSAKLVGELYDVSQAELARWLGRQKQTVFKTPDADSLQNALEFFERIARLRVAVSDEDFRKWLRMPNELLDDRKPIDLIAESKWQVVADLVADIISGNPT